MKALGRQRNWTKEECEYLSENWGRVSMLYIEKKLNRSDNAIRIKVQRMGLLPFLESGDYITLNKLMNAIGTAADGYKLKSWIRNRNMPVRNMRVRKNTFRVINLKDFWKWAEKNRNFLDFSIFPEGALGEEPEWAKRKRREDIAKKQKYISTPWTRQEDDKLRYYLSKFKYTYDDLSRMMRRTNGAIQRRIVDLNLKERPVKVDNHKKWTEEEFTLLGEMIKSGNGYEYMSEKLGKSSKAIRGRVYAMYLSENLDKVRGYIGTGCWGTGRPERKISQHLLMSQEEKQQVKELIARLEFVLSSGGTKK